MFILLPVQKNEPRKGHPHSLLKIFASYEAAGSSSHLMVFSYTIFTETLFGILYSELMVIGLEGILLNSENARELAEWYRDTVGMKIKTEAEMGEEGDEFFEMEAGKGSGFYIGDHSEVTGKNPQPQRILINLEVDSVEETVAKLKKAGAKVVQDIYHIEDYGYLATIEDPDGNWFQVVKTKS